MSREDPQFKLRMPTELRAQAEQSAKSAGRSLNAELVARLEASYLEGSTSERIIPASRAKELSLIARNKLPEQILRRAIEAVALAIKRGHSSALANLADIELDIGIPDEELDSIVEHVTRELTNAGYAVTWDDITTLCIDF